MLDEPFAGLDPIVCDLLTEVLREQAARGVPVLFSSHQLELVEHVCESVAIIDHGPPRGLRRRLRAGAATGRRATDWPRTPARARRRRARARPGADSQQVLDAARRAGTVSRFAEERPTLAELFRDLVAA